MEQNQTSLKANSVSSFAVIVMGISAAAPVMCLSASLADIMAGAGTAATLAFVLATVVLILVGSSFGQLSARYNSAGGAYAYIRSVFGARTGFVAAFLNAGTLICTGVIGAVFSTYLHELVPAIPQWACILILLLPVFFLGWRGVELSTRALIVVWVIQMALIVYPAIRVWTLQASEVENILANSVHNAFVPTYGLNGLMLGVLVCVWCYVGFEGPAYLGEELKGGNKAVKFTVTASVIGIGVIYAVTCWLWTAGMTGPLFDQVKDSGTLLVDYAKLVGYAAGGPVVSIAALVSCVGCFISFATMAPRAFFDMGRDGYLPKATSRVNKFQSPHVSLTIYAIIWLGAALYGSYGNMSHLFTFMSLFASTTYIMVCVANIKDRWHEGGAKAFFVNKLVPLIAIAILVYMIVSVDLVSLAVAAGWLVACIIAAMIWYSVRKGAKADV